MNNETQPPRWSIKSYEEGDEAAIIELFERVFARPMGQSESKAHWQWEFGDNPVGKPAIKLVWDQSRLVGQYAVSNRRMHVDGDTVIAALSLDTMTDPEYGRQGIFSASAEACYEMMQEREFAFVFGFPNAKSIRGFEKRLKWRMIMRTPVHVKALDLGNHAASRLGIPSLAPALGTISRTLLRIPGAVQGIWQRIRSAARVEVVDSFGEWADTFWRRVANQHRIWTIRDREFLNWRYDSRPESDYTRLRVVSNGITSGYAVLAFSERSQGLTCFVMDLVTDSNAPSAVHALLLAIERKARQNGCTLISAMSPPGSSFRRSLLGHGYLPLPEKLFPQELYFGQRDLAGRYEHLLADAKAWYISWGEIDVL